MAEKGNRMEDLRSALFAELRAVQSPEGKPDLNRARAVAYLGDTIINSAKAEIEYMRLTGADRGPDFLAESAFSLPLPQKPLTKDEEKPTGRLPAQVKSATGKTEKKA